jgi:eukaryotic-like serine/threonine-protein kinase
VAHSSDNPGPTLAEHRTARQTTDGQSRSGSEPNQDAEAATIGPTGSEGQVSRSVRRARGGSPSGDDSTSEARTGRSHPHSASHMTARAALEASGLGRMRIMAVSMLALTQVGFLAATVFDADLISKILAWTSLSTLLALFVVTWRKLESTEATSARAVRRVSIPLSIAVVVANLAFGLLSVFCVAVALGLLLFASSSARRNASLAFGIIAGGFAICAIATHFGLYPYKPIGTVAYTGVWTWDATAALVEVMYLAAFSAGRMIRREQARVVDQFEKAVREASLRDALLREARDALKHAAGLGAPGRFSDQELDGFKLGAVIGRGGMGEVYAAERLSDGRQSALKLLRMDALGERSALSRFEREARIIASIQSPNVVQVLAVSHAESVLPYIAMERLSGVDLASHLRERGRLSLLEVVELVSQVAIGLSSAHAAKVVHRDLKPNNIFRAGTSDRPVWKILDFGVSKWMDSADATLTAAELVGTPQYMAPEQARGERDLDQCADLYALSAIAYRCLTGEPPFGGQLPAILRTITEQMPRAPSSYGELPRDIDYVLAIGLAKKRSERFQTAFELSAAFAMAAGGHLSAALVKRAKGLLAALPYEK